MRNVDRSRTRSGVTDVVWVTTAYPWAREPVAGNFHRTQTRALAAAGVAVTVVTPTPLAPWPLALRPRWRLYADAPSRAIDEGVLVVRPRYLNVPGQPSWSAPDARMAGAAWAARADWSGARVVHGHYAIAGLAAWRVARRAGVPLALTFHGSDLNLWPDEHPDRLDDLRTAVRDASLVVTVSLPLAERLRELTGASALHLPIGVDHRSLRAQTLPRDEARQRFDIDATATVVLYVGNLLPDKGIRALVDAVAELDSTVCLEVVGGGPEAGYGLAEPRLAGRIAYRGQQPPSEIPAWMSAADVLVLPSLREGLPTVLVEAGSIGLPVIASAVGGIPDLLADGRGALLPSLSAPDIAAALRAFCADRGGAANAATRLRAHVEADYDAAANAGRLADAYAAIAPRGPTRG